jgi:hypothetical protein
MDKERLSLLIISLPYISAHPSTFPPCCDAHETPTRGGSLILDFPASRTMSQINLYSLKINSLRYSVIAIENGPMMHSSSPFSKNIHHLPF